MINKVFRVVSIIILFIISTIFCNIPVQADILSYPVLKDDIQYYKTTFPTGLRYSEGWYGTFEYAPDNADIVMFDDDKGLCIFALPVDKIPLRPQGGTTIEQISKKDADNIVKSYSLKALCEPYDSEMTDIMWNDDYFLGAQAGDKLKQKFNHPEEKYIPETQLTQKQKDAKRDFKLAHEDIGNIDLSKYDPDRYFVMGQLYVVDVDSSIDITGRVVVDSNFTTSAGGAASFEIYMANGTTCVVTGTNVTGSPITLAAGLNTVNVTADVPDGVINITIGTAAIWNSVNSWSASSGGQCGASITTSADAAIFDANSFTIANQVLTVSSGGVAINCAGMDWTSATNTPRLNWGVNCPLYMYGNVTMVNMTTSMSGGYAQFNMNGSAILSASGVTINVTNINTTVGITLNLGSDINTVATVNPTYGTFNTNGYNITTTGAFISSSNYGCSWNLSSSVIICAGFSVTNNTAITVGTSSIRITGTGGFTGSNKTYYEVQLNGTAHTISGSNTFTNFITDSTQTQTLTLTATTTQTISGTVSLSGSSGHIHTIVSSSAGSAATLTKSGGGTILADYVSLKDNTGSPADTWYYGENSTIVSGVTGWNDGRSVITLSAATNVLSTTATINGDITDVVYDNPTVTMYWGTTDGLQVPGDWDNNSAPTAPGQPQGVAAFYKDVTTLNPGTTYYFSAKATNSAGTSWPVASLSFVFVLYPPTTFTATVNGNVIDLLWTKVTGVPNTCIVRGTMDYPTTQTDGLIVYSGVGTSYSDTAVDVEKDKYYYSAWGCDGISLYSTDYITASAGGNAMSLIFLLGLPAILMFVGTRTTYWIFKVLAGFAFLPLGFYLNANPISDDTNIKTIQWMVILGVALGCLFWGFWTNKSLANGKEATDRLRLPFMRTDEQEEEYQRNNRELSRYERTAAYARRTYLARNGIRNRGK